MNPWIAEPEPWRCRFLHWHRWRATVTGADLCTRVGCVALRRTKGRAGRLVMDKLPGEDYWVTVTSWSGERLYDGPVPVPPEVDRLSPEDRKARRFHTYDVRIIEFNESTAADG
ncbi:MAG: hypothetical protein KGH75_04515 [Rhodospirillales bacterium]|nr:hypothetical protein [Rhodospirillales bacterium]